MSDLSNNINPLLDQIVKQAESGCTNKELFTVQFQIIRTLCQNITDRVSDLQDQITACCGSTGIGGDPEFEECAQGTTLNNNESVSTAAVTISDDDLDDFDGVDTCSVVITGDVEMCFGINNPGDNNDSTGTMTTTLTLLCNGVAVTDATGNPVTVTLNYVRTVSGGQSGSACVTRQFTFPPVTIQDGNGCIYTVRRNNTATINSGQGSAILPNSTVETNLCLVAQCT